MSKHSALNTFGRSGNPAFTKNFTGSYDIPVNERMTLDGAVNKTGILLSLCFGGAFVGMGVISLPITHEKAACEAIGEKKQVPYVLVYSSG